MTSRTEDEDLAQIKDWWQRNGKPLVTGGILALAVVFGWQAWQKYQTNQAQGASIVYQQLIETALNPTGQPDPAKVAELAGKLKSEFGGTHYAQYGSLFVAKVAVDSGKLDDAVAELKAVMDKPADATLGELARQRLARGPGGPGQGRGRPEAARWRCRQGLRLDPRGAQGRPAGAAQAHRRGARGLRESQAVAARRRCRRCPADQARRPVQGRGLRWCNGNTRRCSPWPWRSWLQQQQQEGTPARRTDRLQRGSRVEQAVEPLGR